MQKVGKILDEINALNNQYEKMNKVLNKMSEDEEIRKFLLSNVELDEKSIKEIAATLLIRKSNLESQLRDIEVDIK